MCARHMIAAAQNDAVAVTRVMCLFQRSNGVPARSTRRGAARVGGTLRGGRAAHLVDFVQAPDIEQQRAPLPRNSAVCMSLHALARVLAEGSRCRDA